ncbi:MAG: RecX family transcriptional regulator, partial [Oscillospiraceae bacterium]|nr:RecX family transcriptional regulator [Oscillospiraceae bacterium]
IVERGVRRGYGARRIRQMLYEKKVPRELWDEALAAVPSPEEPIDGYLRANLTDAEDPKQRKRAADALLRRGFEWNDIKSGLRRFGSEADALEDA